MKQPFFSIIIPVYNTQAYIARCLESCIQQTFNNIEILIIDDCGKDDSIKIAKEYAQKDQRIQIIHNTHNLGTFHSRLNGVEKAQGEYCLFVDSDDFIDPKTCNILHQKIQSNFQSTQEKCDICCFGMKFHPKTFKKTKPPIPTKTISHNEILKTFFIDFQTPPWNLCNRTFSTILLQQVNAFIDTQLPNLPRLTMAEDVLQFFIITLFAQKSIGVKNELYCYCSSDTSITRKTDQKSRDRKIQDTQFVIETINKISLPHPYLKQAQYRIQSILKGAIELEYRYDSTFLAYPQSCLKAIRYHHKWQNYARLLIYIISFGKIKL